jgi:hypothetical protein
MKNKNIDCLIAALTINELVKEAGINKKVPVSNQTPNIINPLAELLGSPVKELDTSAEGITPKAQNVGNGAIRWFSRWLDHTKKSINAQNAASKASPIKPLQ